MSEFTRLDPDQLFNVSLAGSIDFMDVWYQDEDAQPPVMTQGMCPNRLGSGEDSAYAVSQAYVVNMPTYVEGKFSQNSAYGVNLAYVVNMPTYVEGKPSQNKRKETPFT